MSNVELAKLAVERLEGKGIEVTFEKVLKLLDISRVDETKEVNFEGLIDNLAQMYEQQ